MGDVFGLPVDDLDGLGTPVEALIVVKCLKPEEDMADGACPYQIVIRRTAHLPTWEAYGMAAYVQNVAFDEDLYGTADEPGD